jgi:hypothetical protein
MQRTFVHVSDFHLNASRLARPDIRAAIEQACGPVNEHLWGILSTAATAKLLRYVRQSFPGLDFLLITGDMFGTPGVQITYDEILGLLRSIRRQGTRIVFCTGTHDHANSAKNPTARRAMDQLLRMSTAVFTDEKQFECVPVNGVTIHGIGNRHHSDRYGNAKNRLIRGYVPAEMEIFVSHCPAALTKVARHLRDKSPEALQHAYIGSGHLHDYDPRRINPYVPGSVPRFVLSQFMLPASGKLDKPISRCGFRVKGAGLIEGVISPGRMTQLWFHEAQCPSVMNLDLAGKLKFRRRPITRSEWKWSEGVVDDQGEHIEICHGDIVDMSPDAWAPVARVGKPEHNSFPVQWLVAPDSPQHRDIVNDVRKELEFYLVEKCEPDPWAYAQYHCSTGANIYSHCHWHFYREGR